MHTKKPRQRNRPRNKCNRLKSLTDADEAVKNGNDDCTDVIVLNQVEMQPLQINDSIRIIQQLIRNKFFKQYKDNTDKDSNSKIKNKSLQKGADQNKGKSKRDIMVKANETAPNNNAPTVINSNSQLKSMEHTLSVKSALLANFQQKVETAISIDTTNTLLGNLQELINPPNPISDMETSDNEDEYVEYIYKPREYFFASLCNFCKCDLCLCDQPFLPCSRCKMSYYCTLDHMRNDESHKHFCSAIRQVAESCGGHVFYKCNEFTVDQFRSYRIVTIRKIEAALNRMLTASEKEMILFPRICDDTSCREYRFKKLLNCAKCGQFTFCKDKPMHLHKSHNLWCQPYQLFKKMVIFQKKYGRLDPPLPTKILRDLPGACSNTQQILKKLCLDVQDVCEYAALTQILTCPLTAWYTLKLCDQLKMNDRITIHVVGAEIDFEIDILQKWELFFLHITPMINELSIVFIGPELNSRNISFNQLKKSRCCRTCRKNNRTVKYHFENGFYHNYCVMKTFLPPDLVCFFNAGLYRSTGFQLEDTWPETIIAASSLKCPVVVTSYTKYESPLDLTHFIEKSNRHLNVALPPTVNPFASLKPERNFISDDEAPLMFKNFYCFVVE